jgi:hypothetical protein
MTDAICPICATYVDLLPGGAMKKHQRNNRAKVVLGERCYRDGLRPIGTPRGDELARSIVQRLRQRADALDAAPYPTVEEAVESYKRTSPYVSPPVLASLSKNEEWLTERRAFLARLNTMWASEAREHADTLQDALEEVSS